MCIESIIEFLACKPDQEGIVEPDKIKLFNYKGEKLFYQIQVDIEAKTFAVSGDFNFPFAYNSLFEVYVEWDRICLETESVFYGEQKILVCRKDYKFEADMKTLMIMKWPNDELSVWPNYIQNAKLQSTSTGKK